jgi:hypothetical protein
MQLYMLIGKRDIIYPVAGSNYAGLIADAIIGR